MTVRRRSSCLVYVHTGVVSIGPVDQKFEVPIGIWKNHFISGKLLNDLVKKTTARGSGFASSVVSKLEFVCIFQEEREGRKNSSTHQSGIKDNLQRQAEEGRVLELCGDCLQVRNSQEDSWRVV